MKNSMFIMTDLQDREIMNFKEYNKKISKEYDIIEIEIMKE